MRMIEMKVKYKYNFKEGEDLLECEVEMLVPKIFTDVDTKIRDNEGLQTITDVYNHEYGDFIYKSIKNALPEGINNLTCSAIGLRLTDV